MGDSLAERDWGRRCCFAIVLNSDVFFRPGSRVRYQNGFSRSSQRNPQDPLFVVCPTTWRVRPPRRCRLAFDRASSRAAEWLGDVRSSIHLLFDQARTPILGLMTTASQSFLSLDQ